MLTIKRQAEVSYNCIELKDALVLVELMNNLERLSAEQQAAEFIRNLPREENAKYRSFVETKTKFNSIDANAVLNVLKQMGFVSSKEYSVDAIVASNKRHD